MDLEAMTDDQRKLLRDIADGRYTGPAELLLQVRKKPQPEVLVSVTDGKAIWMGGSLACMSRIP